MNGVEVDGKLLIDSGVTVTDNSFHLPFTDNSSNAALGTDTSGNSNTWTVNNLSVAAGAGNDSLVDSPTNGTQTDTGAGGEVVGNYATLNPLHQLTSITLVNGNLQTTADPSGNWDEKAFSTFLLKSGKWYCEHTVTTAAYNLCFSQIDHPSGATPSSTNSKSLGWYTDGTVYYGAGSTSGAGSYGAGDILGAAIDMDSSTIKLYKNGSLTITIDFSTGSYHRFSDGMYISQFSGTGHFNFGQRAFNTAAPTGYKVLCTANLPNPTIANPSKYFDTKLWSGDGSNTRNITGLNMSPDLVWTKTRNQAYWHNLYDSVRGARKPLHSNNTDAEDTTNDGIYGGVSSFNSDGFSLATDTTSTIWINGSGSTYVAWAWDAGDDANPTTIAAGTSVTNQAQTWSSNITTTGNSGNWWPTFPATYIFDADTSNYGHPNGNGGACVVTLSFSPSITCGSSVSFIGGLDTNAVGASIAINGGTAVACTAGSSSTTKTTVSFSGSISSITLTKTASGGGGLKCYGFEIDGNRLVDGTAFSSIASPSIASTVRASEASGFSIVSYTGNGVPGDQNIAHGLNAVPAFVIIKNRTSGQSYPQWTIKHKDLTSNKNILFTSGDEITAIGSGGWYEGGIRDLTSSNTFGLGNGANSVNTNVNYSGTDYIAYCFAPVEGYSAMGTYSGGSDAFVFLGFKPALILIKRTDSSGNWLMYDDARGAYNLNDEGLYANLPNDRFTSNTEGYDFLSNGFKVRNNYNDGDVSGGTYMYIAFAEHPFKTARAR